jgi:3D (Asp-Asp-Asp) domain-containing protein
MFEIARYTFKVNFFALRLFIALILMLHACNSPESDKRKLEVTATAYTSHKSQTLGNPRIAAWGDTLKPETNAIAVSRDLLDSGLTYGVKVKIKGLPGRYMVTDKMHSRWKKKIDIYMGEDIQKARNWGKKQVTITWDDSQ